MFSSLKASLKSVLTRIPVLGPSLRFAKRLMNLPNELREILGRVTVLHDQIQALPSLWAPVTEQVWEAQATAAQIMADDLRVALDKARREQAKLMELLDRRLEAIEEQLARHEADDFAERSA